MPEAYRNPPILEVVIEFQFDLPPGGWKPTFAGKIHQPLEEEFPRVETIRGTDIQIGPGGQQVSMLPAPEWSRFLNEDGGLVVTVGPDILGISSLPQKSREAYPGWPALRDRALRLLEVYNQVASPERLKRIGVRYINAIPINPAEFRLDAVVEPASGLFPSGLMTESNPFLFRLERVLSASSEHRHDEVLQLSAKPVVPSGARLMLDVDQIWTPTGDPPLEDPSPALETLHGTARNVFEKAILRPILDSFGPQERR